MNAVFYAQKWLKLGNVAFKIFETNEPWKKGRKSSNA